MRKLVLLVLVLAATAGLSPALAKPPGGGSCITYCSTPNACGYVCCYQRCCGNLCVALDCAPPPPCGDES